MIYMYTHAPKQRTARRIGIGEKRGWTHGGEIEVVEDTAARLPDGCTAVLLLALLCENECGLGSAGRGGQKQARIFTIKAIHLCDLPALVVAAQKRHLVGIPGSQI